MAAAEEKPKTDAAAAPAAGAEAPKSDKGAWILTGLGAVNLIAVLGMGMVTQKMWSKVKDLGTAIEKAAAEKVEKKEVSSGVGQDFKPKGMGVLYPLESFLVNISSDQGPKFLQAQMELELEEPTVEEEIAQKRPAIRDAVIVLLSSRSYRDLRDASGVRALRTDLMRSINGLLSTGKIKEIYFTQFHFN